MNINIKNELKAIVGPERFQDRPEDLLSYSYDADVAESVPEVVLLPETTEEVSQIMKVASKNLIPVTARGAGSSICGAPIPIKGGILLSFTRMNKILDVSPRDRFCVVQPGVVNGELQAVLAKDGFFYPPDPGSMAFSTIGGNVAQNAGGPRCLKYGVTVDYVLGMEVVLANGEVIRFGSPNVKDVTGYRLSSLFCGSEGTLGIMTEVTLKILPQPEAYRTVLAVFNDLDDTAKTVSDVIGAGILPAAMELMDNVVINCIEDSAQIGLPKDAQGMLLIEVDGNDASVESEMVKILNIAKKNGAADIKAASTDVERNDLWAARRSAFGVMSRLAPDCITEDATVPVSRVPDMIRGIREIVDKYKLKVGILAHAGDGNMHPMISTDKRDKEEWCRVEQAVREIFNLAISMNGTLSGEHGIGLAKQKFLPMVLTESTRKFMATIKAAADPDNILNPGKAI